MTKILCVEDSEDSLFTLHKRLVLAGFEVKVAMNGAGNETHPDHRRHLGHVREKPREGVRRWL